MTGSGLTVICTEALSFASANEVAVTVTCCGAVRAAVGGVYAVAEPVEGVTEPGPVTVQATPLAAVSLMTVARMGTVKP
jgi:hypothetical protein